MKSLFVLGFIFLLLHPLDSFAANKSGRTTTLTYGVYAGGIHAVDAALVISNVSQKYEATLTAATQGFLKTLANWAGKFSSKGLVSKGQPFPLSHISSSTWKEKTETKTFKYNGNGKFLSYNVSEEGRDTTPKDIDKTLSVGTTDVLSATLSQMMILTKDKVCRGNSLIYDGDRSYRLIYAETKPEILKKSDYNIFGGEAISCTVEVKPEKGKWRKKPRGWLSIQEQGRQKGALPTIWFGQIVGQPNFYVPVKIRVKTDYGTLFMHLTSAKTK